VGLSDREKTEKFTKKGTLLRFSKLFAPTTKEAPKDALLPSHIYLVRGGFISQVGSGIYNFLPLGKMVLDKISKIVKEELDAVGALETQLGFVTPLKLWKQSGRVDKFGKELLRFKDRKNNEFVLGPTYEEAMVDLVKGRIKSYKQLPINLYQINTKFRDEARPRYGLLRAREFLMKDGYSFHEDEKSLDEEFVLMEKTYEKILKRLGLEYRVVFADSGAIGGSGSKEFMALAENGEDDIVLCTSCTYAANIEAALRAKPKMDTPKIKTVVKKAIFADHSELVVFFVGESDTLQETKALSASGALELVDASDEEPENAEIKKFVDLELKDEQSLISKVDELDYHLVDLVEVSKGDLCSCCGGVLDITKGIEVGHIFKLGDKYAKALDANFLDRNGKAKPFVMGTYGMGISRLVAVVAEQHHDEKGPLWTKETSPFFLSIIISNIKDEAQKEFGENLYKKLQDAGVEVLLDDRAERFGYKMSDFELLGFPKAVIVGKGLVDGEVQIVDRKTLEKTTISKDEIFDRLMEL
jgi:prolyl-tRNA synthetase